MQEKMTTDIITKEVSLFGHTLKLKNYCCSTDGKTYKIKDKAGIHLRIVPTYYCPCSCPFCVAESTRRNKSMIDTNKLERVLRQLKQEDILRGITITGGEPFMVPEVTIEAVDMIFDIFGPEFELTIDSCGVNIDRLLGMKNLPLLDTVHISRHHYDDEVNKSIFNMNVPTKEELTNAFASISYPDVFVLNCMLMKDYIGSTQEVKKYLEHAIELGAKKVSFISGMPSNSFIATQALDYLEVIDGSSSEFLFTRGFQDYDICRCQDGIYVSEHGDMIEFYGRCTLQDKRYYSRGLLYDGDNFLKSGFGGEILI